MTYTESNLISQYAHAERSASAALSKFISEQEVLGFIVTTFQDEVISTPSPARVAYDKVYPNFSLGGFALFRQGFEMAAQVARDAALPDGYQWGADAMESFNFGKERAALSITGAR